MNYTIEKKIVIGIILFTVSIIAIIQYQFYQSNINQFLKAKTSKDKLLIETILPVLSLNTSLDLYESNSEYLKQIIKQNSDIKVIVLKEKNRKKQYLSLDSNNNKNIKDFVKRNKSFKELIDPLTSEKIGEVYIYYFDEEYQSMIFDNIKNTLYIFSFMLILLSIFIFLIKREFKYLRNLSNEVLNYNPKNNNHNFIKTNRKNEVGIINNAIVSMVEKISDYSKSLDEINQSLERKIKDRTKELEHQTQKAQNATKVKSQFLANMSHEIRTPMNGILGMAHLVLQTKLNEKQKSYVTKINQSAKSLLEIINDILDISKIEAGKLNIDKINFDLFETVDRVIDLIEIKAIEKRLDLIVNYSYDIHKDFYGDNLRIGQIITNLLSNAIKFTDIGEVSLNIIKTNDSLYRFEVVDTGIGLSDDEINRLFNSFSQADGSTTRKYGGTGLGLAISKQLVELMDGKIWIESVKGEGSKFIFEIPLKEIESTNQFIQFDNKKVLIVDDNNSWHDTISNLLNQFNIKTDHAFNAKEAVLKAHECKNKYDLILMDWSMPNIDGIQATKMLREMCDTCKEANSCDFDLPPSVMMISSFNQDSIRKLAKKVGIDIFLQKPINPFYLNNILCKIFLKQNENYNIDDNKQIVSDIKFIDGSTILLTEDSQINQDIILGLLENNNINIDIANNGKEAVDKVILNPNKYDLILMDLQMPIMDGYEASNLIRNINSDIPIVALTANIMKEDIEKTKKLNMQGHLKKPIEIDKFYNILFKYIKKLDIAPTSKIHKVLKSTLPKFTNINTEIGMHHLAGNEKVYIKVLNDFANNYSTLKLTNTEDEESQRDIHTIKGLAGNIGAIELYELSEELNEKLDNKLLDGFNKLLQNVTIEIKEKLLIEEKINIKKEQLNNQKREELFLELKEAIFTKRINLVQAVVEKIEKYDLSQTQDQLLKKLISLVKKYNFKEAIAIINSL